MGLGELFNLIQPEHGLGGVYNYHFYYGNVFHLLSWERSLEEPLGIGCKEYRCSPYVSILNK